MKTLKMLSDFLPIPSYTVIILCFLFPFFLVKCGNVTLMSVKGTDLITGVSKQKMDERMRESIKKSSPYASSVSNQEDRPSSSDDSQKESDKGDISPNLFVILSFLMAVAGIAVQLMKTIQNKSLYHLGFSVTGLLGFLGFYLSFKAKMEDLEHTTGMGMDGKINIAYSFGEAFYIAAALFSVVFLFFGIYSYLFLSKKI
ncbi:MAG: hypothetical protein GXO46_13235 [Chlorobi bacterium]|uniref:hypothetical protein n=1 Tax=Chryseobacterium sp. VD8 TaxID=3081254 RepID=UPI0024508E4D|nr:hypothetical protein [Chlorobiota bacterium]